VLIEVNHLAVRETKVAKFELLLRTRPGCITLRKCVELHKDGQVDYVPVPIEFKPPAEIVPPLRGTSYD
jgi:hypothetical protein